jgi:hypothetical protein
MGWARILRMVRPWAETAGRVGLPGSLATWLHMTRRLLIGPRRCQIEEKPDRYTVFSFSKSLTIVWSGMCVCLALPLDTRSSSLRREKSRMLARDLPALGSKPFLSALCNYLLSTYLRGGSVTKPTMHHTVPCQAVPRSAEIRVSTVTVSTLFCR